MGRARKYGPKKLPVKQSIVVRCMQYAIQQAEKAIQKANCTREEILYEIRNRYPNAFDGTNPPYTLITSKLFPAKLAVPGIKRTCTVSGEYASTYRLTLPEIIEFSTEPQMKASAPRKTRNKTGRKRIGVGLPAAQSPFWTFDGTDFRDLLPSLGRQQRQALMALLTCLKDGVTAPTNDDVGERIKSAFGVSHEAARKRLSELEKDYSAIHAVRPVSGVQYWKAGPANGEVMRTTFLRKHEQERRLKNRLYKLVARSIPRLRHDAEGIALILGCKVEQVRKHLSGIAGPRWREAVGHELFPEEEKALETVEAQLRKDGKL